MHGHFLGLKVIKCYVSEYQGFMGGYHHPNKINRPIKKLPPIQTIKFFWQAKLKVGLGGGFDLSNHPPEVPLEESRDIVASTLIIEIRACV